MDTSFETKPDPDLRPVGSSQPIVIPKPSRGIGKKLLVLFLLLVLLGGSGFGSWWYANNAANKKLKERDARVSELQQKNTDLQKELDAAKSAVAQQDITGPTATTLAAIEAAIKAGKYSDVQTYLANSVTVTLAASEGLGARTAEQTVKDLDYLKSATGTWDFALPKATLDSYAVGTYKSHFPANALVGKSGTNNYVVSFSFNSAGKVSAIFMTADAMTLTQ